MTYSIMLRLANGSTRIVSVIAGNPASARYMAEAMFSGSKAIGHSY